jgi:hypothetical protein
MPVEPLPHKGARPDDPPHDIAGMKVKIPGYSDDLAYIHEARFTDFARTAALKATGRGFTRMDSDL